MGRPYLPIAVFNTVFKEYVQDWKLQSESMKIAYSSGRWKHTYICMCDYTRTVTITKAHATTSVQMLLLGPTDRVSHKQVHSAQETRRDTDVNGTAYVQCLKRLHHN